MRKQEMYFQYKNTGRLQTKEWEMTYLTFITQKKMVWLQEYHRF